MSTTPNLHLPLMEPSQAQPEVVYNAAMEILDAGGPGGGGSLEVEQSGASPGVLSVTKIIFSGPAVSVAAGPSTGDVVVTIDTVSGAGGSVDYPGTVADLAYWFKSDEPLLSSGYLFDVLPNFAPWNPGQVAPLVSGTGGSRSGTPLNSKGVTTFPANSKYVLNAGPILNKITAFFVYKPASVTTNCTFINGTSANCLGYYTDTNGKQSLVATGVAVIGVSSTALTNSTWVQGNVTYNSSTGAFAFRLNRATDGSGTNVQAVSAASSGLGSDSSGASPLNGDLAELIIYKRVLSGTEITNVENYLNVKWGV